MTKEQEAMLDRVTALVKEAKMTMVKAQDKLAEAAEACKGTPLEDHLNSQWDAMEDLRFDIGKQLDRYAARLREPEEVPA